MSRNNRNVRPKGKKSPLAERIRARFAPQSERRSVGSSRSRQGIAPERVLAALADCVDPTTTTELAKSIGIRGEATKEVSRTLRDLVQSGQVIEIRPGRFLPAGAGGEYPVQLEKEKDDIVAVFHDQRRVPVHPAFLIGGQEGDEALAMVGPDGQALLTRLVRRGGRELPGTLSYRPGGWVFIPDQRRAGELPVRDVPKEILQRYNAADRVIGELVVDELGRQTVNVTRIMDAMTPEVHDFERVRMIHDLTGDFTPPLIEAAKNQAKNYDGSAPEWRKDLTGEFIFTIDPETAKDFDDAVSLERLRDGSWRLGVHVADVAHFVQQNQPLDLEAAKRGTSCYLANRVIPMLPEELSNGICSLRPDENRYTLSIYMKIEPKRCKVREVEVVNGVIRSRHRLSYEEAMALIDDKAEPGRWPEELAAKLKEMNILAQKLRKEREKAGSINLFSVETRFAYDVEGRPIEATPESADASHQLIEEFMLLANRSIAAWLEDHGLPCVWRVHDEPDEERLEFFQKTIDRYGLGTLSVTDRGCILSVLKKLSAEPPAARLVLNMVLLRCFAKAHYTVENIGHYALAFDRYCHFTSPIRRYPDLLVHRLVKVVLQTPGHDEDEIRVELLDAMARRSSWLERRAQDAERDIMSAKAARYLQGRLGEVFQAVVMSPLPSGLICHLLEAGADGYLPAQDLGGDYFSYNDEEQALVGSRSGHRYNIGTELSVIVSHVDIDRSEVNLTLANTPVEEQNI